MKKTTKEPFNYEALKSLIRSILTEQASVSGTDSEASERCRIDAFIVQSCLESIFAACKAAARAGQRAMEHKAESADPDADDPVTEAAQEYTVAQRSAITAMFAVNEIAKRRELSSVFDDPADGNPLTLIAVFEQFFADAKLLAECPEDSDALPVYDADRWYLEKTGKKKAEALASLSFLIDSLSTFALRQSYLAENWKEKRRAESFLGFGIRVCLDVGSNTDWSIFYGEESCALSTTAKLSGLMRDVLWLCYLSAQGDHIFSKLIFRARTNEKGGVLPPYFEYTKPYHAYVKSSDEQEGETK